MADIKTRAVEIEARLREQVLHHRNLSNPLYMSEHGRLLHEAAETIAALRAQVLDHPLMRPLAGELVPADPTSLPAIDPPAPLAEVNS
ncbi:hypothetical protein [Stenotrophomonas hibiscicola]|uniref:hypothetical protein n=1 Tax=Stenotrophomonas hibiscicola TaxID=86189 RepID=UPI00037A8961|nr:hypothetical protein [[Pseudomonas] hibiscicola]